MTWYSKYLEKNENVEKVSALLILETDGLLELM